MTTGYVKIPKRVVPLIKALLLDAGREPTPENVADFFSEAAERWMMESATYRNISF